MNKMRMLREMIDRRARERLENELCGLSRQTSFSDFYELDEFWASKIKTKKARSSVKRQSINREGRLSGMICERPSSTGFTRDLNITRRLQKNPRRKKVLEQYVNNDI